MSRCYISAGVLLLVALLPPSILTCWAVSLEGEGRIQTISNDVKKNFGSCAQAADEGNPAVLHECTVTSSSTSKLSSTATAGDHPSCTSIEPSNQHQLPNDANLPAAPVRSTPDHHLTDISHNVNQHTTTTTTNTNSSEASSTTSATPPSNPPASSASTITQSNNADTEEPLLHPPPPPPTQPTLCSPLHATTPSPQPSQGPAAAPAADPLSELQHLLAAARQAVAALEAAVDRQETRMKALPPASAAADAYLADAGPALVTALGLDPFSSAVAAAREALRRSVDQVLSEQRRRPGADGVGSGGVMSSPPGSGCAVWAPPPWGEGAAATGAAASTGRGGHGVLMPEMGPGVSEGLDGGVGGGGGETADWFRRHFSLRAAVTTAAMVAAAPDAGGNVGDGEDTGGESAASAAPVSITCTFPYELPNPNTATNGGGALQYVVVGDAAGVLYLLSAVKGSTLTALPTGSVSAITACAAYYVRSGESMVVTGHADGATRSFHVVLRRRQDIDGEGVDGGVGGAVREEASSSRQQQTTSTRSKKMKEKRQRTGEDAGGGYDVTDVVVHSIVLRHVVASMPHGALPWAAVEEFIAPSASAAAARVGEVGATDPSDSEAVAAAGGTVGLGGGGGGIEMPYTGPPAPIMHILPFRLGQKVGGRRLVLVLDRAGNMRLERDNGTVRHWVRTNRTQLAVRFVSNHVVMISAHHATIFNTMQMRPPRAFTCQNLNGSRLLAASFDGHRPFRGFGVNTRGELVTLVTPHEGGLAVCKATRATPLPWLAPALAPAPDGSPSQPPPPLSLTPLRGYLLMTHGSSHVLFNVTGVTRMALPPLAAISDEQIARVAAPALSLLPSTSSPSLSCPATGPAGHHQASSPQASAPPLPPGPVLVVGPGSQVLLMVLPPPPHRRTGQIGDPDGGKQDPKVEGGVGVGGAPLLVVLDSRLPKVAVLGAGNKMWSQPIFIAAMLFVGLYQFWRMSSGRATKRAGGGRGGRFSRRGPYGGYGGYGGGAYGDAAEYMYGENRVPMQPRSALRRTRSDRPMGRSVTYEDEEDY